MRGSVILFILCNPKSIEIVVLTVSRKKINTKDHELFDLETILEPTDLAHLLIPARGGKAERRWHSPGSQGVEWGLLTSRASVFSLTQIFHWLIGSHWINTMNSNKIGHSLIICCELLSNLCTLESFDRFILQFVSIFNRSHYLSDIVKMVLALAYMTIVKSKDIYWCSYSIFKILGEGTSTSWKSIVNQGRNTSSTHFASSKGIEYVLKNRHDVI